MLDASAVIIVIISILPILVLRFSGSFVSFAILAIMAIAIHGTYLYGPEILYLLLITFAVSTVAELISLTTPISIFGAKYRYTINHQFFSSRIRFLGVYPLEISLAWVILKYLSYSLAMLIAQAFGLPYSAVIFGTPLILMSLNFILDPVAVNIKKYWTWEQGSAYFGIPIRNFLGWYAVGLMGMLLFSLFDPPGQISYNILYLLPILFYGSFIKNSLLLFRLNKKMAMIGAFPAIFWTMMSTVGLIILYIRQA